MKANELRIGNKFYLPNGEIGTVSYHEIRLLTVAMEQPNYKPISITEEWLLKFGFKLINEPNKRYHYGRLCLQFCKSRLYPSGRTFFNNWAILDNLPKHVHQLQNLYFALTGEELTIKEVTNEQQ